MQRYRPDISWCMDVASPMMAEDSDDGDYYHKDDVDKQPFREHLEAEIAKQEVLIKRMDSNPDFDNGMMTMIRLERLSLLERLLDFEPKHVPQSAEPAK